jgi:glycosyltransferase involved in cell wall biosynthesis
MSDKLRALIEDGKVSAGSRILFVNDGSRDGTWDIIKSLCLKSGIFAGISLSRNRGHQNALFAGLMAVRGAADAAISLDADLQDDIDAVDAMVDNFLLGCDVVYAVRSSRGRDTFFKRFTARGYYRLLRALGCEVVFDHADYRLLSRRALGALGEYGERDLFLRGIVPMIGFKSASVSYVRGDRMEGESKYTLKKMLTLAFDGVMSLSLVPARLILAAGLACVAAALTLLVLSSAGLILGPAGGGAGIIAVSVWGVGGLILLGVGVVGEYAGRAYLEAKRRPRYFISDAVGLESDESEQHNNTGEIL